MAEARHRASGADPTLLAVAARIRLNSPRPRGSMKVHEYMAALGLQELARAIEEVAKEQDHG